LNPQPFWPHSKVLTIKSSFHMMTKNDIAKDLNTYFEWKNASEITIKGAKGAKVNVNFQGLHMTNVIFALVYNLKFYILNTPFNVTF
jgi:hypothetical protein